MRVTFSRNPRVIGITVISARAPDHRVVGNRPAEVTTTKAATIGYDISWVSRFLDGLMCDRTRTQNEY